MKKQKNKIFIILIILFILILTTLVLININSPKEGTLKSITYKETKEKIDKKESFILVVSQSTCSHCAAYKPKLTQIAKEYGIDIFYIDYDTETKESQTKFLKEFNLDGSTPITIFINDGNEKSILNRIEGDISKEKAIEKFKKMGFIK